MSVKLKEAGKFEFLYLKDVVAYYASVQSPKPKYQSDEKEFAITVFISEEDRAELEDNVKVNKQIFEVGKDKNKKRAIKYPLKDKKGEPLYEAVAGLHGMQLTQKELNKQGKKNTVVVADAAGEEFKELVGNGSRVNIKCFGYRSQDGLLNISLNIVQVIEHVPYEGGDGGFVDDELGVSYNPNKSVIDEGFDDAPDGNDPAGDDGEDY